MDAALSDVVTALGDRIAPTGLARERTLPVADDLVDLFPDRGLVRGRMLSCTGAAATSLALRLIARAAAQGAWVAMIDLPTIGLDAASEFGVPLERVVAIDSRAPDATGSAADGWPEVMAAAVDGFDIVLAHVDPEVRPAAMRRVGTRIQQRGAVVIVLGDPGPASCDGVLRTASSGWTGVGRGHGHLRHRGVVVEASGRRLPGMHRRELAIPA